MFISGPVSIYYLFNPINNVHVYLLGDIHGSKEGGNNKYMRIDNFIQKILKNKDFEFFTELCNFNTTTSAFFMNLFNNKITKTDRVHFCLPRQKEFIKSHKLDELLFVCDISLKYHKVIEEINKYIIKNNISSYKSLYNDIVDQFYKIFKNNNEAAKYFNNYAIPLITNRINSYDCLDHFDNSASSCHNKYILIFNLNLALVDSFLINGIMNYEPKHKIIYYGACHINHIKKYLLQNGFDLKYSYERDWHTKDKRTIDVGTLFDKFL